MKISKFPIKKFRVNEKTTLSKAFKYQIFDGNVLVGEIVVSDDLQIWTYFEDKCYYIDRFKVKTEPTITDFATQKVYGHYHTTKYRLSGRMPSAMALSFDGVDFSLTSLDTDTKFSVLKKSTWGLFKFEFKTGENYAIYDFDIPQSIFAVVTNNPYVNREFEGTIDNHGLTPFQIVLGMAIIEKSLYTLPPDNFTATSGI